MSESPTFENARKNARPDCPKCHGTGTFKYDRNHSTICSLCCKHNMGWELLKEFYGNLNGKWCCRAGCGFTRADNPAVDGRESGTASPSARSIPKASAEQVKE